jgi:SAM-dependent methyltransferase
MDLPPADDRDPGLGAYVPETRFGVWFQRSDTWRHYVVSEAVAELKSLLPAGSGPYARVLDAGCGEGVAFAMLEQELAAQHIVGIDIDAESVERAEVFARQSQGRIEVRRADGCNLPLASDSIDLVFCHQLLHHAIDPPAVLAELYRVLRPGGWLLVAESCRSFLDWWPVRLLFRHPRRVHPTAPEYEAFVRRAHFELDVTGVLTPSPWWSRPDLGLWERHGGKPYTGLPTQVRIAARKSDAGSSGS